MIDEETATDVFPDAPVEYGVEWNKDPSSLFASSSLPDDCIDAANRAAKKFSPGFPGWQLYSRIVRGDAVFDRQLASWAIGVTRRYSRAIRKTGHPVVAKRNRSNDWIAQAGLDALHFVIFGNYPESARGRTDGLDISHEDFIRLRNDVVKMIGVGFSIYTAELHYQLSLVRRDNSRIDKR